MLYSLSHALWSLRCFHFAFLTAWGPRRLGIFSRLPVCSWILWSGDGRGWWRSGGYQPLCICLSTSLLCRKLWGCEWGRFRFRRWDGVCLRVVGGVLLSRGCGHAWSGVGANGKLKPEGDIYFTITELGEGFESEGVLILTLKSLQNLRSSCVCSNLCWPE